MARKYTIRSKEEKLNIVKRHLAGEAGRVLERETSPANTKLDGSISRRR